MNNVISTKVNIFRNLKDYKFVPKLEENKKQEIVEKLEQVLKDDFTLIDLNSANQQLKDYIENKFIIQTQNQIFLNKQQSVAIVLFEGEHITIVGVTDSYDSSCIKNAKDVAGVLANKLNLSFNDQYGYLMSNLIKIGSGIKIESVIDLNAINQLGKIAQVKQNISQLGYSLKETKDKNLYKLSTICNLGFSENEIFSEYEKMLNKLQDLEFESAKMLEVENRDEFLDKVQRSFAILKSAYIMSYDELKTHISNLRLGLNLGLIDLQLDKINMLQHLANKNAEFISKSEMVALAKQTQTILKGEKDV